MKAMIQVDIEVARSSYERRAKFYWDEYWKEYKEWTKEREKPVTWLDRILGRKEINENLYPSYWLVKHGDMNQMIDALKAASCKTVFLSEEQAAEITRYRHLKGKENEQAD